MRIYSGFCPVPSDIFKENFPTILLGLFQVQIISGISASSFFKDSSSIIFRGFLHRFIQVFFFQLLSKDSQILQGFPPQISQFEQEFHRNFLKHVFRNVSMNSCRNRPKKFWGIFQTFFCGIPMKFIQQFTT